MTGWLLYRQRRRHEEWQHCCRSKCWRSIVRRILLSWCYQRPRSEQPVRRGRRPNQPIPPQSSWSGDQQALIHSLQPAINNHALKQVFSLNWTDGLFPTAAWAFSSCVGHGFFAVDVRYIPACLVHAMLRSWHPGSVFKDTVVLVRLGLLSVSLSLNSN